MTEEQETPERDTVLPDVVRLVVDVARAKLADEIKVLDLRGLASFTDFFVVMSGNSTRQVQAVGQAIEKRLKKDGVRIAHVEGVSLGEWVLVDCFDFVVHVFTPEKRRLYDLERLWNDAPVVEVPEVAPPLATAMGTESGG